MRSEKVYPFVWAAMVVVVAITLIGAVVSAAAGANDGVCSPQSAHVDPGEGVERVVVSAPEGSVIVGYCVKAGSAKQGLGPEYVYLDPGVGSVSFGHSSGKDISHYVVFFGDVPVTTTTVVETTTTLPEIPPVPPVVIPSPPAPPVVGRPDFTG